MIDFIKAEKSFKDYLKNYDLNDGNIKLKVKHTYEVVKQSEYISKGLGLDQENIELAINRAKETYIRKGYDGGRPNKV